MRNRINLSILIPILLFQFISCSDGSLKQKKITQVEDSIRITNEIIETKKRILEKHPDVSVAASTQSENVTALDGSSITEDEKISNKTSKISHDVEDYLGGKKQYHEFIALAYVKAKSNYLNTGEGNFSLLSQEIKNQYPQKIRELETFYIRNKRSFNNELFKEYQNLKIKMQNLFQDAFQTL